MSILATAPVMELIGKLFQPVADLIDNVHTSKEEKIDAKTRMFEAQSHLALKILDYEAQLLKMQGTIINSEAKSEHMITAIWRPVVMLTFLVMIVSDVYGWTRAELPSQVWTLLQLGLGGYVVGRSAEKVAASVASAMGKK